MDRKNFHLSDEELLLAADGELSMHRAKSIQSHLTACWSCRARMRTIEDTIADFVRSREQAYDWQLPPPAGPRALLQSQMAAIAAAQPSRWPYWRQGPYWIFAAACLAIISLSVILIPSRGRSPRNTVVAIPRSNLTPGAVVLIGKDQVCTAERANNRPVPASTRRSVFEAYGISGADTRLYEVDYLITPALGGSDDIRNLWPQSYSSTIWNAHVKDQLEEHLRGLVCSGHLDLSTAQREISRDWIAAYKKYFHTDRPIEVVNQ